MTREHCSHAGSMNSLDLSHQSQLGEVSHRDIGPNSGSETPCVPAHRDTQQSKHPRTAGEPCQNVSAVIGDTRHEERSSSCTSLGKDQWEGPTKCGVCVAQQPGMVSAVRWPRLRGFARAENLSRFPFNAIAIFLLSCALHLAGGTVTTLTVARHPSRAVAREVFVVQPQINLLDSAGELDLGRNWQMRASIISNSSQPLGGTTFITAVNGTADFSDLVLARPEENVVLRFTLDGSSSIFVESRPFEVVVSNRLLVFSQNCGTHSGLDAIAGGGVQLGRLNDGRI